MNYYKDNTIPSDGYITDKEIFIGILEALDCRATVDKRWHYWGGQKINEQFPRKANNKRTIFTKETISIICSMLSIALMQSFGEELFTDVDYNAPLQPDIDSSDLFDDDRKNMVNKLFRLCYTIIEPAPNTKASTIYTIMDDYLTELNREDNPGLYKMMEIYKYTKIMQLLYVFFVRFLIECCMNTKHIKRLKALTLFEDVYCSYTFYADLHSEIIKKVKTQCVNIDSIKQNNKTFVYKYTDKTSRDKELTFVKGYYEKIDQNEKKNKYENVNKLVRLIAGKHLQPDEDTLFENNSLNLTIFEDNIEKYMQEDVDTTCILKYLLENNICYISIPDIKQSGATIENQENRLCNDFYSFFSDCKDSGYSKSKERRLALETFYKYVEKYCPEGTDSMAILWFVIRNNILCVKRAFVSDNQVRCLKDYLFNYKRVYYIKDFWDNNDDDDDI